MSKKRASAAGQKRAGKASATGKGVQGAAKKGAKGAARLAAVNFVQPAADAEQNNLNKIEHIVVLMLENRSFDHLLGYLKLESGRTDVDGLTSDMSNIYNNQTYRVHHLAETHFKKGQDPCHDGNCVTEQLSNNNGGFVSNYVGTHPGDTDVSLPMGYYNASSLPVYDHLARNFLICNRWFCSVDGATWPNRLYAVTGRADGSKNNKTIPLYSLPSFVRQLTNANVNWRWYAHDISTLRITDEQYRVGHFKHFSYFDSHSLFGGASFLDDAANGNLAPVSWIDPNFGYVKPSAENDDHPPADIMAGQELALKLYNAVINSPQWNKTLLVIVYDEHGGLYDHVPTQPAEDDNPNFRRYGVRVPAFVVSPWVERGKASNIVFDHTSLIKTILLRFCQKPDGSIPDMGARVTHANHLGGLLTLDAPRPATPIMAFQHLIERVAQWRSDVFKSKLLMQATGIVQELPKLNELQEGVQKAKRRLRAQGLPEGQP